MMIPTISIDGVSMLVTRDGTNLLSNMPLGEVASQVLEQGAAFEAAVEQFQQIMAEFTTGESVQAYQRTEFLHDNLRPRRAQKLCNNKLKTDYYRQASLQK